MSGKSSAAKLSELTVVTQTKPRPVIYPEGVWTLALDGPPTLIARTNAVID
jgi:hypothetical protein